MIIGLSTWNYIVFRNGIIRNNTGHYLLDCFKCRKMFVDLLDFF